MRIDLGVFRADRPDVLLLGIEFDGPAYAQAATARDRDRLRREVLGRLGWNLHRIWAADWLYRREGGGGRGYCKHWQRRKPVAAHKAGRYKRLQTAGALDGAHALPYDARCRLRPGSSAPRVFMHREISHTDSAFEQESNVALYLMTALLGALMALDLLPALANATGYSLLTPWPRELYGYRFAFIAAVLGGIRVVYSSLSSLFEGRVGADLALAIAAVSAIVINEPLVAAEVVFIGMVGECLEAFTFARAQNAVRKIVEVFPRRCWLLRDGQEVRVFTSEVQVGDRVVVKPGAKVPVDGVVIDGRSGRWTPAP